MSIVYCVHCASDTVPYCTQLCDRPLSNNSLSSLHYGLHCKRSGRAIYPAVLALGNLVYFISCNFVEFTHIFSISVSNNSTPNQLPTKVPLAALGSHSDQTN